MLSNFGHLLPEVIFTAAERLGGQCTGRFLTLNAMENRVYDLELEGGEHRVIKFYRPGRWTREQILIEHAFLKKLLENEIPVVCPIQDASGETLFEHEGILYTVFPKTAGRLEPELNREQLERLGRFLARLHNVGATLAGKDRLQLDVDTYGRQSLQTLIELDVVPQNTMQRVKTLVTDLCDLIGPALQGMERVLLHGDCHCGNILWRGNEPFFIDFDDMLYAPPVQDIWMLTGGDDSYGRENRELLLESYEEIREFNRPSLHSIEALRTLRMIYFNAWIARRRDDGAFKAAFPAFGSERYWQEQIEGLSVQREKLSQSR